MTLYALLVAVPRIKSSGKVVTSAFPAVEAMRTYLTDARSIPAHQIKLLPDATRAQVLGAFNDLHARAQDGDTVLVMFAGHGFRAASGPEGSPGLSESARFGGWLLTGAGDDDDKFDAADMKDQYKRMPRARWIVLSDCCFGASINRAALPLVGVTSWLSEDVKWAGQLIWKLNVAMQDLLSDVAQSSVEALRDGAPEETEIICIAGASDVGEVSDEGELLFVTLTVGDAVMGLSYASLTSSFKLVKTVNQAFVLDCPPQHLASVVLSA